MKSWMDDMLLVLFGIFGIVLGIMLSVLFGVEWVKVIIGWVCMGSISLIDGSSKSIELVICLVGVCMFWLIYECCWKRS